MEVEQFYRMTVSHSGSKKSEFSGPVITLERVQLLVKISQPNIRTAPGFPRQEEAKFPTDSEEEIGVKELFGRHATYHCAQFIYMGVNMMVLTRSFRLLVTC